VKDLAELTERVPKEVSYMALGNITQYIMTIINDKLHADILCGKIFDTVKLRFIAL
jgi:hypothetical protein